MRNNRTEYKPDPLEQQLNSTVEKIDQVQKPIQHLESLIKLCDDKGLNKAILKPLNDIKSFQNSVGTGVEAGSIFGPPGMIIGFAIGTVSFIKGRKRARKDAKKPDPFMQYLNANFDKINNELEAIKKSLQEMKEQLTNIYECQVFTINLLHDGLIGLYQQNRYLEQTVIKLHQKVIDHVNRVQKSIEIQGKDKELNECKQSWFRAESWMKWNSNNSNVNHYKSKIQNLLSNLINIIRSEGLATRSTLNGSASFKVNQVTVSSLTEDEWMLGELSNNDKSLAELVAFIAYCGVDRYKWELDLDIDQLPNFDVWQDGVDAYGQFIHFCLLKQFKFPEETLYFDEIINVGNNFLKFSQYLQTPVILNLLNEYLSNIKNLENLIFEKFQSCMVINNQDKQINKYQNYLKNNETINKLCAKIDFTLVLFSRCVQLAGYQKDEISLLNNLMFSNQILEKTLTHSNSVIPTKFRNGFLWFHLDLVKCIYGEKGIIPIYSQKISLGNNYFSGFHTTISSRISLIKELRGSIFPKNLEDDSQNQQPNLPTTTHIIENIVENTKQKVLTDKAKNILSQEEKISKITKAYSDIVFHNIMHNQTDTNARGVVTLFQHQQGNINHLNTLFIHKYIGHRVTANRIILTYLSKSDCKINSDQVVQEMENDLIKINEECKKSTYSVNHQYNINNNVKIELDAKSKKEEEMAQQIRSLYRK